MDNKLYEKLLNNWEEVYKKGQLTLWILLSLKAGLKYIDEIKEFIILNTDGTFTVEEQSLYRALRRFYDLNIVDYKKGEGNKGPERKYYYLTDLGKKLLKDFLKRNIEIFYKKQILNLIK